MLLEYTVGVANVRVIEVGGRGYYIVEEPKLDKDCKRLISKILDYMYKYMRENLEYKSISRLVEEYIYRAVRDMGLEEEFSNYEQSIRYYILRDTLGYGKIDVLMRDPNIEEVAVEGPYIPVAVVHRGVTEYRWLDTNIIFYGEEELKQYVQKLALKGGKSVSSSIPMVEVKLPEGHRAALTYSREVSGKGSSFVIRKFPEEPLTITHLLTSKTLSFEIAAYLWKLIEAQQLIFIIGPMASGKTTLLQALTTLIPPDSRVVTVEDSPELNLSLKHWDPLYSRRSISGSSSEISLDDLLKFALRRRAEYLIVGEVRGEEVRVLVQAASSGHGGLTTLHSDSVESMLLRLKSPPLNVREAFISTIGSTVAMKRVRVKGKTVRRVFRVSEVYSEKETTDVFTWDPLRDEHYPKELYEVIDKSLKLRVIGEREGVNTKELVEDLKEKMQVLRKLVKEELYSYDSVSKIIASYYYSRSRL